MKNREYIEQMKKIKPSDELINKTIMNIKQVQGVKSKEKMANKVKNKMTAIIATISALVCGGIAFAAIKGMSPADVPDREIKFSDEYEQYEQVIENGPFVEKDGTKITLQSTVADEGFVVLKFNVKLNENQRKYEGCFDIAFNDEVIRDSNYKSLRYSAANRIIIIDGQEYWEKGATEHFLRTIKKNQEYEFYQLWFLGDELKGKEQFTITLNDVAILFHDEDVFEFNQSFNIDLSKEQASKNTKTIQGNDSKVTYKKMTETLESIKITPLQNIVELHTIQTNVNRKKSLLNEDYVGMLDYEAFDQNNNKIQCFYTEKVRQIEYEDGQKETMEEGDLDYSRKEFDNATLRTIDYLAIEKNEDIKSITIQVISKNDHTKEEVEVGKYYIDLEKATISSENNAKKIILQQGMNWDEWEKGASENNPDDWEVIFDANKPNINETMENADNQTNQTSEKENSFDTVYVFKFAPDKSDIIIDSPYILVCNNVLMFANGDNTEAESTKEVAKIDKIEGDKLILINKNFGDDKFLENADVSIGKDINGKKYLAFVDGHSVITYQYEKKYDMR